MDETHHIFAGLSGHCLQSLREAVERLSCGYQSLPGMDQPVDARELTETLLKTAELLQNNYPYHHPFYLGQMMKPPAPIAQLAYMLAMSLNPNNHALDGGRASSQMEKEAVAQIGAMVGWPAALGHLCGGGTIANLEALWVARELTSVKAVAVSDQAHYTHARCSALLGIDCSIIESDELGRMSLSSLEKVLQSGQIGTVIVTLGTTALGAVDPLEDILKLREKYSFRVHIDSAYGGYFRLSSNLSEYAARQYSLMQEADSIVIDPHKHGLQPYGCGCVLFKDVSAARVYKHDSPYTYFSSDDLHLGEISLECSRAGAAAVALWATLQAFPLTSEGAFASNLEKSIQAAQALYDWVAQRNEFFHVVKPELDIVVWGIRAEKASTASRKAKEFFDQCARQDVHLALVTLPHKFVNSDDAILEWDQNEVTCLRSCLMKPEHLEWMPKIFQVMEQVSMHQK